MAITKLERGISSGSFNSLLENYMDKLENEYDFTCLYFEMKVLDFGDKEFKDLGFGIRFESEEKENIKC